MFYKFVLEYSRTFWKIFPKLVDFSVDKVYIFSVWMDNFSLPKTHVYLFIFQENKD